MAFKIRPAVRKDAPGIAQVLAAVWSNSSPSAAHIAYVLGRIDRATHVAVSDGEIIGFVNGFMTHSVDEVRRWEVDLLAVHPAFRGQGIGTQLVATSANAGREQGARLSRGLIQVDNLASQRAFAHCGYFAEDPVCGLYVSGADDFVSEEMPPRPDILTVIPVLTLTYRGLWLEGELSAAGFVFARWSRARLNLDVVGAVIPLSETASIRAAESAGFGLVDHYQWWWLNIV